jgi:hypothetical protein
MYNKKVEHIVRRNIMAKKRKRRTTSNSSTTKVKQKNFPIVDSSSGSSYDSGSSTNSSYDSGSSDYPKGIFIQLTHKGVSVISNKIPTFFAKASHHLWMTFFNRKSDLI